MAKLESQSIQMNIAKMHVNDMIGMFAPLIQACKDGKEFPAINLSGAPGVGKSDAIKQIANIVETNTGKKTFIHDVRLLNMNPVDLRGIPAKDKMMAKVEQLDENGNLTIQDVEVAVARWLRPAIFQMDPSQDVINFLFLDEITAAPPSVQAAAYQLVLDRKVGEHMLPNNCFVFSAGNRVADKAVAYRMSTALANRMCHIEIVPDVSDWKIWALNNEISPYIIGFINYKPDALFQFHPEKEDLAYPTPRSWSMVNKWLTMINNPKKALPLIQGCIGTGTASDFYSYIEVYASLPDYKGIFDGKDVEYPKDMGVAYALASNLSTTAAKANKKQLSNMLNWLNNWRTDFAILTIKDCMKIKDFARKIAMTEAWINFCKSNEKFLNVS